MVRAFAFAALAALAVAAPRPQDLDFAAIDALPDYSTISVDAEPTAVVAPLDFNKAAAIASVVADISADPLPAMTNAPVAAVNKRASCTGDASKCGKPIEIGSNYLGLDLSSADAFRADPKAAAVANAATAPHNYLEEFKNKNGSISMAVMGPFSYASYTLPTYDVQACADKCDARKDGQCIGFNIYLTRQPQTESNCACPKEQLPTALVKCVIWGAPVPAKFAKNTGQPRPFATGNFITAVAASNGYSSAREWKIPGFAGPNFLDDKSINAPNDCNKKGTYMGNKIFSEDTFDPSLCAAACNATNLYNSKHDRPNRCRFFNTYILEENGSFSGQYCAMYTQRWDDSFATNKVQWRGDDFYTKYYSFTYWNGTNDGTSATSKTNDCDKFGNGGLTKL